MTNKSVALISGVSREQGLGFEVARQLVAKGFHVIATARDISKAKELAAHIGAEAQPLDITNAASIAAVVANVRENHNRLDVLINNAGAYFDIGKSPLEFDDGFASAAFDTNLFGPWRLIQAFLPLLKAGTAGRIVNVSSGAGSFSDPTFGIPYHQGKVPVYSLTKLALNGLTLKLAQELKDTNIKINSVCPGFVATYPGTEEWGARPVADGAMGIVWAATLDEHGPSGGFFRDGKPLAW